MRTFTDKFGDEYEVLGYAKNPSVIGAYVRDREGRLYLLFPRGGVPDACCEPTDTVEAHMKEYGYKPVTRCAFNKARVAAGLERV